MKKTALAVKCIIVKDDSILILSKTKEESIGDYSNSLLDIPGGRLEIGEDPMIGLLREVKEETGLEITDISLKNINLLKKKTGLNLYILTYLAKYKDGKIQLSNEHEFYTWVNLKNCSDLPSWIKREIIIATT